MQLVAGTPHTTCAQEEQQGRAGGQFCHLTPQNARQIADSNFVRELMGAFDVNSTFIRIYWLGLL